MDNAPVIRSFEALMAAEPEVADAFLLAAVYASALRGDTTPREVVDRLFKAMPSTEAWGALKSALLSILDDDD